MGVELVTIVILTYNDEPEHLSLSIGSALRQTYPRVEIVVVDDGSTKPGTIAALQEFEDIRLIRQANGGTGSAANTGIRAASGELILRLDGDNWIECDTVDLLVSALRTKLDEGVVGPSQQFAALV